jgi:hypothetical protein
VLVHPVRYPADSSLSVLSTNVLSINSLLVPLLVAISEPEVKSPVSMWLFNVAHRHIGCWRDVWVSQVDDKVTAS